MLTPRLFTTTALDLSPKSAGHCALFYRQRILPPSTSKFPPSLCYKKAVAGGQEYNGSYFDKNNAHLRCARPWGYGRESTAIHPGVVRLSGIDDHSDE